MQQRLRNRVRALRIIVEASALYTLAEIMHARRGEDWHRLEARLDVLDDRMDAAEAACKADGDWGFVDRVGTLTDRVSDTICRLTHPAPAETER